MTLTLRINQNLKKVLFLLGLTFFSLTLIAVVKSLRASPDLLELSNSAGSNQVPLAQTTTYTPQLYEPEIQVKAAEPEKENLPVGTEVKGAATGCKDFNSTGCVSDAIAFQPVCTQVEAGIGFGSGQGINNGDSVTVSKNSRIEIWKVTSPLAILSGKESVEDNTFAITDNDPAFRSAGYLIDTDFTAGQFLAPGEDRANLDQIAADADYGDFSVHVSPAFGGSSTGNPDQATINPELESSCTDVQPSEPNPDRTNKVADQLVQSYAVPNQPIQSRDFGDQGCVYVDPSQIDLPSSDVYETCVNQRSPFDFFSSAVFSVAQWAECATNPEACEDVELVGIVIDAPFGSNYKCADGFCADQFFDTAVASEMAPSDVEGLTEEGLEDAGQSVLQAHYVTTPCKVRVDYSDIYDIPCLWDVSPYWAQYQLERQRIDPNNPDFPTWEEYWHAVELEAERRGAQCTI